MIKLIIGAGVGFFIGPQLASMLPDSVAALGTASASSPEAATRQKIAGATLGALAVKFLL